MSDAFVLNLRLSLAVALVTVWAVSHLVDVPYMGDVMFPLVVAPMLLYTRAQWLQPMPWRTRGFELTLVGIAAVLGVLYLLSNFVSEERYRRIDHSPFFVVPVWSLMLWALAKRATAISGDAEEVGSRGQAGAERAARRFEPIKK